MRLVQAGYRRDEAMTIFFGIRVVFALAMFSLFATSVVMKPNMALALGGLGLGYILPAWRSRGWPSARPHSIRLALADALDLLVVSVEAGLGLDQALTRVGSELAFAYPDLSDELRLVNLELRAGKPRPEALRNLADRTGVDDLQFAGDDAHPDRQVRHERRPGAARLFGDAQDQASAAGRRSGCQDGRQDGVPAGLLHLSGNLGCHHRSGRYQVHQGVACRWSMGTK